MRGFRVEIVLNKAWMGDNKYNLDYFIRIGHDYKLGYIIVLAFDKHKNLVMTNKTLYLQLEPRNFINITAALE
ncbi:hypothetical protein NEPAR06_0673 [Nematocida parisii]|uniref:Uncharacterized protein n=1 Tax=Nematocida parisii (strain ERTm3) TaxID=935791 RepID=I3EHT8_NEMP3|nr:hypothetical protein NEQG_00604 [Nematocida parisii ERTm3]KAI5125779.1 hypothetical protein NEPAR03_0216 [Nematocida parisii]KAI5126722.1 hypothetical protein NEPAR08_0574 [Nematocida parisii]KAI5142986.1 hypothetical protein NEPAR07_0402 [Nematocida parisii]KAI5153715.1 hypothetical protein NEPAR06_0673 [Nematocida parisii]